MPTSLTYFDFDGSRGLECRLALTAAGVEFEDIRINREQWAALKPTVPFGALPVMEHDGHTLAQCNAILAYIGRQHGMHPTEPFKAAQHDAIMQSIEDLRYKVPGTREMSDEDKKAKREAFAKGFLTQWARTIDGQIEGPFLDGDALNVADIKLYVILRSYLNGVYDHIPEDTLASFTTLRALYDAVDAHPAVQSWFNTA